MSFRKSVVTPGDQSVLAERERRVQWRKKIEKAFRKIASRIEVRRSGSDGNDAIGEGQGSERRVRLGDRGCHGLTQAFPVRNLTKACQRIGKGNSKANGLEIMGSKPHSLNEIWLPLAGRKNTVGKGGKCVEKLAHHR